MTKPTIHQIAEVVGASRNVRIADMISPKRHDALCRARAEIYTWAHGMGYSLPRIGRFFNRHHTTVLHGIRELRNGRY